MSSLSKRELFVRHFLTSLFASMTVIGATGSESLDVVGLQAAGVALIAATLRALLEALIIMINSYTSFEGDDE